MTDAQTTTTPTKDKLRAELEKARADFHELASSLGESDWKVKSGNEAWTVGQLMWHMAWGTQFTVLGVDGLRGKKQWSPPRPIFNVINPWLTRLGSRGANKESVTKKYDEAHEKAIAALATVSEEDLGKTVVQLGEEHTVAYHFGLPARHFEEHNGDILRSLGRA